MIELRGSGETLAAHRLDEGSALGRAHDADLDVRAGHPLSSECGREGVCFDAPRRGAAGDREQDLDGRVAARVDRDLLHHAQLGDGAHDLGIAHALERAPDGGLRSAHSAALWAASF